MLTRADEDSQVNTCGPVTRCAGISQSRRAYSRSELTTLIGSRSLGKGVVAVVPGRKQEVRTNSSSDDRHGNSQLAGAILRGSREGGGSQRRGQRRRLMILAGHGGRRLRGNRGARCFIVSLLCVRACTCVSASSRQIFKMKIDTKLLRLRAAN